MPVTRVGTIGFLSINKQITPQINIPARSKKPGRGYFYVSIRLKSLH